MANGSVISEQLIKDLYAKYNPEADIEKAIELANQFENNQEFVKAFYKKYAPEKLTPQRLIDIKDKYYPTQVSIPDSPEFSPVSEEFIELSELTTAEKKDVQNKFGTLDNPNYDYLKEKSRKKLLYINNRGKGVYKDENYFNYTEDLGYTEDQLKTLRKKIADNPEKYNIDDLPSYKEIFSGGIMNGIRNVYQRDQIIEAKLIEQLKDDYIANIIKKKIDNQLANNEDYYAYYDVPGYQGKGNIQIQKSRVLKPDYEKFEKEKIAVKKDIKNYMDFSKVINDTYEENLKRLEKIKTFQDNITNPNYKFDVEGLGDGEIIQLKDGRFIPANEYLEFIDNVKIFNSTNKSIEERMPYLKSRGAEIQDLAIAADLLGRDYDMFNKFLARVGTGFGGLAVGTATFLARVDALMNYDFWTDEFDQRMEEIDKTDLKWQSYSTGVMNKYAPDIKFKDAFKNKENLGRFLAQEVSTQLPIITTMVASGGTAGALGAGVRGQTIASASSIGIASAGEQYGRMTYAESLDDYTQYSIAEKFLISSGYGLSEAVFGTAPSYFLLKSTYNTLTNSGKKIVGDSMMRYLGLNVAAPVFIESGSEGLTTIAQNILTGRPTFENVDHSVFSGAMFGALMNSSPAIAGMYLQKFGDIKKYEEFRNNNSRVNQINARLKDLDNRTVAAKTLIKERDSLIQANENILSKISNNVNQKVSKYAFGEYMKAVNAQEEIREEAQAIVNDTSNDLTRSEKNKALQKLQNDFDLYQSARDLFRNETDYGNEFNLLKASDPAAYDSFITKAFEENANFDDNGAFKRASELYFENKYDDAINNVKKITKLGGKEVSLISKNTNKEVLQYIKDNNINVSKSMLDKFNNGSLNGIYFKQKNKAGKEVLTQILSRENSIKNERAGTGYHEISHAALYAALGDTNINYAPLAESIMSWLKTNDTRNYSEMFKSFGPQRVEANAEEVIVNFLERVAQGKIKRDTVNSKVFMATIAESLSKVSDLNLNFASQTDAINLLIGLGEKIADGSVSQNDINAIKLGFEDKLNKANENVISEPVPKVKASDSQAIQTIFNNKGAFLGLEAIANNKYIKQEINNIVNKYRDVPKYNTMKDIFRDELINDDVYGILGSLLQYDAKRNPVLASHILFRLKQKSKTIAEKVFEQKFTEDVSEAKKVVSDVTDPEILEQRESLRTALGLTPDIINKVKNAVVKTFGTKLPNVKDAQFRKALQKNYRTELKPTIATMLGRQDNYRAFLENNFELVYSILPQSTLNKRFKDFIEPVVDESGKQLREKTAEGKKVFKKKKITKNEFVNYFLGDNVGASTKGTRKTALSEALAEEIAFDATLDVIREPEIFNKIQTITQIAGQTFDTNYLAQVAKEIDRATDFKFSLSDAVDIMQLVAENSDMLASSFDVFFAALVKGQAAYNVSVKDRKGQALEYYVSKELEGLFGDRIKILNADELAQLKTGDTGVDIQVELDGKVFGFEVKNSISDIIGSKSGKTGILKEFGPEIANQMFELADQTNNEIIEELNRLNIPYTLNPEGFIITDKFTKDGKKVSDIINISRTKTITLNGVGPIARLYESKGVQYMYFADKGWRSLNTNALGLNIESIHALGLDTVINVTSVAQTLRKINAPDKTKFGIRAYYNFGKNNKVVNANTIKEGKQTNEVFLDVKASQTVNLDLEMNNIIQEKTGIDAVKVYSKAKGEMVGKKFGRGNIFIPWSAEDLNGFFYGMAGKGPKGEAALKFFNENINRPYNIAIENLNRDRMQLMDDFKALKKNIKSVPKKLKNTIPGEAFTYEQAVRVYAWNKMGYEIADLSNADLKALNKVVIDDPALKEFGNTLIAINKGDGYPKPKDSWLAGTIETDLYSSLNEVKRAKYLEKWKENVDIIFSKKNKNKLRAAFGNTFVENLENILKRMETGRNRPAGGNKMINGWLDWINGSVGAIMFFNMRSAMLQTISMANYINWSDNNLLAASRAFANQPQFMSDFLFLFNSDYLKERRGGLKLNVQESELVEQANKNGVQGVISLILKQGFIPTRLADSFAISMGGASMYRNRVKKYTKEGLSQKEAESKAFQDFMALTEESQQSSRPDKISAEQASSLGRLFLAFANTPMQYNRMIKRAGQDLINKRGDWKTNVSKITYYTFIQNFIFNAMQQALFKLAFGDEEEDKDAKLFKVGESMVDSILRGTGISGQIALTSKNVIKDIIKDEGLNDKTFLELFDLSPPINSKVSKLRSAGYLFQYADKEQMKEIDLRNPGLMALAYVLSAVANIPADRAIRKANNVESAMSEETELWQKIALIMGWNEWELGVGPDAKKQKEKNKKKNKKDDPLRGLDNFEKRMRKNL